jgi:hypothetical protein
MSGPKEVLNMLIPGLTLAIKSLQISRKNPASSPAGVEIVG